MMKEITLEERYNIALKAMIKYREPSFKLLLLQVLETMRNERHNNIQEGDNENNK